MVVDEKKSHIKEPLINTGSINQRFQTIFRNSLNYKELLQNCGFYS